MIISLRSISNSATLLLGAAVALSAMTAELPMTLGIATAGGLCLLNFGMWQAVGRGLFQARLSGSSPAWPMALWALKLLIFFGGFVFLLQLFPPAGVAIGGSALVLALLLQASRGVFAQLEAEEA
jgi:hypothetical protein